ncbi:hypothetical protein G6O69_14325 [Pseudenhygromyxa sp. WMMC2535]|uniref:hypothetical protein n=1 Tax=Pseudenhygromyxa sp. WMMC2535 TaxID=2712867 RepID=UPI0015555164|nr:hypothetical protein [Pseudenhygromyxa sp. WMMC2535]NVB39015.1 hypothetical protein [Pseudenhygromyxa sp. WMMC2535]
MSEIDDDDDVLLAELGCLKADERDDHSSDEPLDDDPAHDLDLTLHHPPEDEAAEPVPRAEDGWIDMGARPVARSAAGLRVMNTIEVLPPFELSI